MIEDRRHLSFVAVCLGRINMQRRLCRQSKIAHSLLPLRSAMKRMTIIERDTHANVRCVLERWLVRSMASWYGGPLVNKGRTSETVSARAVPNWRTGYCHESFGMPELLCDRSIHLYV